MHEYLVKQTKVSLTVVELSISGAEGTWLTRVRVSARVVASPQAHSGSGLGSRKGGRGWDTTMVVRRVWVTGVTTMTVSLALILVEPPRLT